MKIKIDKPSDLAPYLEHTNLKPEATPNDIIKLCEEAKKYGFFGGGWAGEDALIRMFKLD